MPIGIILENLMRRPALRSPVDSGWCILQWEVFSGLVDVLPQVVKFDLQHTDRHFTSSRVE
jgi:hypothetical protein